MTAHDTHLVIVGAGPVGLMCAYLAQRCGLSTVIVDQSDGPLAVGRADALNARTLQLLEIVDLFAELYPLGKVCNTSSVWSQGQFVSRQSSWWDELAGCLHQHFLMIGQSYLENLLDKTLKKQGAGVRRCTSVKQIDLTDEGCLTTLDNGETIHSRYLIGADGSRSFVRQHFAIPFTIIRPEMVWAVIDGIIETDFPKVPEIIVFQADTSDVAWIPREGEIDRFYVRMDTKDIHLAKAIDRINRAMTPHTLRFKTIVWFSQFSVKESVAEQFAVHDRIFLAGDACHIHSVNGGQGLNTGLADAFNLIWKINRVVNGGVSAALLHSYDAERRPVAQHVIETSGELVRSTKYSEQGTHAKDYVRIIEKRAGYITGMGIRYGEQELHGSRLFDFDLLTEGGKTRLYSLLDYRQYTLLIVSDVDIALNLPDFVRLIQIYSAPGKANYWADNPPYKNQALLVRPDSYIEAASSLGNVASLLASLPQ